MTDMTVITGNNNITHNKGLTDDLYKRFIEYVDAKPKTVQTYTRALRQLFLYFTEQGTQRPERADILAYRDHLLQTKKAATVQAYIVAARLFFQWTEQEGLYPNIAARIKGAKISKDHKKDYLSSSQMKQVLQSIQQNTEKGLRDYAILALMVTGGLRTIEVTRANIEDLRTAGDSAVLYIQGKGKDEKADYVKLPAPVDQAIRAYLSERGALSGPLFASTSHNNQGQGMTTKSISSIVKNRLRAAGFNSDRLTAHSLRHTAGTLNLLNGGTLEETQQLLRHNSISTTMIYLHHINRANNMSENRIAGAVFA